MNALLAIAVLWGVFVMAQAGEIGSPPGKLVEVSGRKLHLLCSGSGAPTVILEAGASSFAIDWTLVQREIARTNRVCSYDRAGMGWSELRNVVDTPARVVADLHALLAAAAEKPPYIMVGASRGGVFTRLYQLEYPDDVAGFVLVDPTTEDRLFTVFDGRTATIAELTADQYATTMPTKGPLPITPRPPQTGAPFDRLPPELYQLRIKLDQRLIDSMGSSVSVEIARESMQGEHAALARLLASRSAADNPFARVPVIVLTRGQDRREGLADNHARLARLSSNSRHTVVATSGHEVHLFAPAVVIEAIHDVATAVRERSQLPLR
jgi:pimeloyl-ACP methyl ester carboxylesterase